MISCVIHLQDVKGCDASVPEGFPKQEQSPLCHVVSGKNGEFSFGSLPLGEYSLVPFYQGKQITFDVAPQKMDFSVGHASLELKVSGCSGCYIVVASMTQICLSFTCPGVSLNQDVLFSGKIPGDWIFCYWPSPQC
jgi:hypothetical protein